MLDCSPIASVGDSKPATTRVQIGAIHLCLNDFERLSGRKPNADAQLKRAFRCEEIPNLEFSFCKRVPIRTGCRRHQVLYFSASLRHYSVLHQMNRSSIRGVLPIYKEGRAITARLSRSMQEWILTETGGESEAVDLRKERAQAEALAARHREWESLLAENAPLAFRVARGVLRNDADAEDVAQEALLRAHRRFEGLRERTRFRTWLVRISFRIALDRLRAIKRRQVREAQWVLENSRIAAHQGENAEFQRQFDHAMDELPEKQRLVLFLAAMEGHTLEEVSLLLAVPIGTVKSRLFFARKTLAEKLRCFVNPIANR
jgi:RNA polymerase sigma-70 factor (ECF subfamily)